MLFNFTFKKKIILHGIDNIFVIISKQLILIHYLFAFINFSK